MVTDALAGNRTIGLAMLKPGWESDERRPPIHTIGGAGEIVESEELPDGRYNILVEGKFRYRILSEDEDPSPYRIARVEEIVSVPFPNAEEEARVSRMAARLFEGISGQMELSTLPEEEELSPESLASQIALRLRYTPEELQKLLETDALSARFGTLIARMIEWQRRIQFLAPFRPKDVDGTRN